MPLTNSMGDVNSNNGSFRGVNGQHGKDDTRGEDMRVELSEGSDGSRRLLGVELAVAIVMPRVESGKREGYDDGGIPFQSIGTCYARAARIPASRGIDAGGGGQDC